MYCFSVGACQKGLGRTGSCSMFGKTGRLEHRTHDLCASMRLCWLLVETNSIGPHGSSEHESQEAKHGLNLLRIMSEGMENNAGNSEGRDRYYDYTVTQKRLSYSTFSTNHVPQRTLC